MHFRIIKLTNNNNHREFTLEITRMKDVRQRVGILVADYNNYLLSKNKNFKPCYNIVSAGDFSFYTVYRGEFDTYHQCKEKRTELYNLYNKKVINAQKKEQSNIISFE